MDFISMLGSVWPDGNFWASIIKLFDVGSYAWTIILFTIVLKLVLSPIDFAQRYFTNKQTRAQAKLQPELEKLKKRYGQNQNLLYQKQNELYKKNNVKMSGSCIIMIVYMAVTLTVFLTLWNSMQSIAGFKIGKQYEDLQATYNNSFETEYLGLDGYLKIDINSEEFKQKTDKEKEDFIKAEEQKRIDEIYSGEDEEQIKIATDTVNEIKKGCQEKAQLEVANRYMEIKDNWAWIKNIWRPDKATVSEIPDYNAFKGSVGNTSVTEGEYNLVMGELLRNSEYNKTNGYYILSIIVVCVSLLSQLVIRWVSRPKSKTGEKIKTQQPGFTKIMMFIMPLTMLIFTLNSSAIFAIYIITNSIMTTLITPLTTVICNKIEERLDKKHEEQIKVDYRR